MHKSIFYLLLLLVSFSSCTKEETVETKIAATDSFTSPSTEVNQDSIFQAALEAFSSGRSGARFNYYARYSHTSTNYLLAQQPDFVATEVAFNTDSIEQIIHKRYDSEIVNIGGIFCGIWSITHQYKDGTEEHDIYFSRDTSLNYFVIKDFTANNAKFTHNFMRVEREPVAMMDYYDFGFKKWKKKGMYTIKSKSTAYRDRLASKLNNSNIFRLNHA